MSILKEADFYYGAVLSTLINRGICPALVESGEDRQIYLAISAFSHSKLIQQLEYEGYSSEEATYAADRCGANWCEQAAKSAEAYLKISAFSQDRLIQQLEYEGFTPTQAAYGVAKNGYLG